MPLTYCITGCFINELDTFLVDMLLRARPTAAPHSQPQWSHFFDSCGASYLASDAEVTLRTPHPRHLSLAFDEQFRMHLQCCDTGSFSHVISMFLF
jgi:hypothetical protein